MFICAFVFKPFIRLWRNMKERNRTRKHKNRRHDTNLLECVALLLMLLLLLIVVYNQLLFRYERHGFILIRSTIGLIDWSFCNRQDKQQQQQQALWEEREKMWSVRHVEPFNSNDTNQYQSNSSDWTMATIKWQQFTWRNNCFGLLKTRMTNAQRERETKERERGILHTHRLPLFFHCLYIFQLAHINRSAVSPYR